MRIRKRSIMDILIVIQVRNLILTYFYFYQHPPRINEVLKYMAEAIISRRGYTADGKPELRTEIITYNQNWTVPKHKGNISVRIFGAGATGSWQSTSGRYYGGSGWMNNAEFNNLTQGQTIQITVGQANTNVKGYAGGSTSFGTYLSANGGSGSSGGAGGAHGGDGYQFGGGGDGNGGTYGGGGGGSVGGSGRPGGMYGGGGGGGTWDSQHDSRSGGNGGMYGGGGGCGLWIFVWWRAFDCNTSSNGIGGTYGGNGSRIDRAIENNASFNSFPEDGTNTIGNNSVPENLRGTGKADRANYLNIRYENSTTPARSYTANYVTSAGGGGFGGMGGQCGYSANEFILRDNSGWVIAGGAGGGGYGGNGASVSIHTYTSDMMTDRSKVGGGGGGYGGDGESTGSLDSDPSGGGGGGYFANGYRGGGGGWYNYCHGGGNFPYNTFSFGTGGCNNGMAMSGACIIQYYA